MAQTPPGPGKDSSTPPLGPAPHPAGQPGPGAASESAPAESSGADSASLQHRPPEALTSIDERGRRKWVFAAAVRGRFMRARKGLGYFVIAVFFVVPWLKVDGMQAILLDIPQRHFVVFGTVFLAHDLFYLVYLLVALALGLFFFTAVAGRVWCGWLCPQTVFMEEVFRKIDEWVDGDHHAQHRLDRAPWTAGKWARRIFKHLLFAFFSLLVSNTFLMYFVGTERLLTWMLGSPLEHWTAFLFMASIGAAFYFDFAWFREQFCVVLCPYARFQSVLTDAHTIQVGYDVKRGEPRGRAGHVSGDCVDCHRCVVVCPTAIDIRDGYQLECIGCARCIDACDEIMDRLHRPRGLVRLDSLARLEGQQTKFLRPRVLIYSAALVGVLAVLFVGLGWRPLLDLTVVRPPGDPFTVLPGDLVSNRFQVHLHNRGSESRAFRVAVSGLEGAKLVLPLNPVSVPGNEQTAVIAFIQVPAATVSGRAPASIIVYDGDAPAANQAIIFLAPIAK